MAALPRLPGRKSPNQYYDDLKNVAANARRFMDREAWLNVAYYHGEQYTEWFSSAKEPGFLREVPEPDVPADVALPRPVANKIMHFANQTVAFALQSKPVPDVLPANDDPLSDSDARVANAYVHHLSDPNVVNFDRVLFDATVWAVVANNAYIKWVFDPTLNRPDAQFVPSTDLFLDPYARDFYKARWAIHSQFMDPEQVYNVYGQELPASAIERADPSKTTMLRELGQSPVMEGVVVNEYWCLPNRRFPKGKYHVWAGVHTLYSGDFPYDHGGTPQLPFTIIGAIPRPNSQFYDSPVTYLREPQTELNYYHAQRLATRKAWANLKLYLPEGLELEEPWNNAPNQVIKGSGPAGEAPQIIGPPGPMPDNNDGEWLRDEMQHVVGLHEVSQGQVPGRVEAAKAIELLRESDTSRLNTLIATTATAISRGWWQTLMNARQFVDQEVIVNAYSKEGVPEVHRFMTDQFQPGMRVRVTVGSGLAFSRAARLDQLLALWQQGVLRDPEAFAELADIPVPSIISTSAYDVRLARNENLTLAGGQAITANSWDNHTIHIREHNNFRKTSDFAALLPSVKARFEHHVDEHRKLEVRQLQEEAQKAALLQQAVGPQPSGAGATPGPSPTAQPATVADESSV